MKNNFQMLHGRGLDLQLVNISREFAAYMLTISGWLVFESLSAKPDSANGG